MALRPVAHHRPAGVDDAMAASRITALGTRSGCLHVVLELALGPVDGHRPRRLRRRQGGGNRYLGDRRAGQLGQPLVVRRGHVVIQFLHRFEALGEDERHRLAPVRHAAAAHRDDDVGLHFPRLPGGVEAQPVGGELPAVTADRHHQATQRLLDPIHPRGVLLQRNRWSAAAPCCSRVLQAPLSGVGGNRGPRSHGPVSRSGRATPPGVRPTLAWMALLSG